MSRIYIGRIYRIDSEFDVENVMASGIRLGYISIWSWNANGEREEK